MSGPLISLIIPVYNVQDYLEECLDSVLLQDYENFEVVAVNDGSTDNSREILENYERRDSRIRVIDQRNKGLAGARNTGVAAACGDYIAFVDSDDYVTSEYLSAMAANAITHDADVSICGRAIDSNGSCVHHIRSGFSGRPLGPAEAFRALNSYSSFDMSMWGKLFKADLFEGIEFPEGKNSEDQFVCYRLLLKASRAYYEDKPFYVYRHREGSISRGSRVNVFPIEASHEQLRYVEALYPDLIYAAETSCFFSQVAVYNAYAVRDRDIPDNISEVILSEPKSYLSSVLGNSDIPKVKKIQALAYCFARPVYRRIYLSKRG